jgi:hypothetical protein
MKCNWINLNRIEHANWIRIHNYLLNYVKNFLFLLYIDKQLIDNCLIKKEGASN